MGKLASVSRIYYPTSPGSISLIGGIIKAYSRRGRSTARVGRWLSEEEEEKEERLLVNNRAEKA